MSIRGSAPVPTRQAAAQRGAGGGGARSSQAHAHSYVAQAVAQWGAGGGEAHIAQPQVRAHGESRRVAHPDAHTRTGIRARGGMRTVMRAGMSPCTGMRM